MVNCLGKKHSDIQYPIEPNQAAAAEAVGLDTSSALAAMLSQNQQDEVSQNTLRSPSEVPHESGCMVLLFKVPLNHEGGKKQHPRKRLAFLPVEETKGTVVPACLPPLDAQCEAGVKVDVSPLRRFVFNMTTRTRDVG